MSDLGRILIGIGLLLVACGAVVLLVGKLGLPLGRLPGDFSWRGKHTTVYFPLATSIVLSVVLSRSGRCRDGESKAPILDI